MQMGMNEVFFKSLLSCADLIKQLHACIVFEFIIKIQDVFVHLISLTEILQKGERVPLTSQNKIIS